MQICTFFFFNDTATTEIYTLSLHDALPIWRAQSRDASGRQRSERGAVVGNFARKDRKSTRLNSSHMSISYAVFCLKKKKKKDTHKYPFIYKRQTYPHLQPNQTTYLPLP